MPTLVDKRRRRQLMFFEGPQGRYSRDLTRRITPKVAADWGFLMNMPVESFRSVFDKFAAS